MKKLEAIIHPNQLTAVKEALAKAGLQDGLLISEIKAFESQARRTRIFRGSEHTVDLMPEIKLELVVPDGDVEFASAIVATAADPENTGSCRLFVYSLDAMVRIRREAAGLKAVLVS